MSLVRKEPLDMVPVVAVWGLAMIICAGVALFVAPYRGRNGQNWAFWCFLVPPALGLLFLLPVRIAPIRVRAAIDKDDLHELLG